MTALTEEYAIPAQRERPIEPGPDGELYLG